MPNSNSSLHPVIGLEVHAELKTQPKMFCGCKNDPFGAEKPNIHTCPVCLGMPGALPVANKTAIEWTIKIGLALNCKINLFSKFDRKHYFYPDLPKGYQISQYDLPFCYDGYLNTSEGRVRIRRIHLEEDTAKLVHGVVDGEKVSLIDFNRSSVPLVEIVTEPDIKTGSQAKEYGKKLRQTLRFLDVADCDMEQGGMRLEANISLSPKKFEGQKDFEFPNYKVEVKNINSFRFMEQAIDFEIKRQAEILEKGETPIQETRGYNSGKGETFSQRIKESAEDYRYFPDPDLPPIEFTQTQINKIKNDLPELPNQLVARWQKEFNLEEKLGETLSENSKLAKWIDDVLAECIKQKVDVNKLAKVLINKKIKFEVGDEPRKLVTDFAKTSQTDEVDEMELEKIIAEVLTQNPDIKEKYQAGKTQIIGFAMGLAMREIAQKLGKKVEPQVIQKLIIQQVK